MDTIVWENLKHFGYEYLEARVRGDEISVDSTVILLEHGKPLKVNYKVHLLKWKTKKVTIEVSNDTFLVLSSDLDGIWFDQFNRWIPNLDGAIDIDISATPFSNSLPINRFDWKVDQLRDFEMVYVSLPSLELKRVPQRYTYVGQKNNRRTFRYESPIYQSSIYVDEKGYVVEYPKLFKRRY